MTKTTILSIAFTFLFAMGANAQCATCTYTPVLMSGCPTAPPKPRGIYVNEFFEFVDPFYGPTRGIDATHSILGVDANKDGIYEKEDALLNYCKVNSITRLTLYDIGNIMKFPTYLYGSYNYMDHLKRFITKAKTGAYGITEVGVTISSATNVTLVGTYNGIVSSCVAPRMASGSANLISSSKTLMVDLEPEGMQNLNEEISSALIIDNNSLSSEKDGVTAKVDALNSFKIDHMVTEFEFWNSSTFNTLARRDSAYLAFQSMLNYMSCLRASSVDPLLIYTYLGYLDKDSYNDKTQAQFIDNIADKIFISNYKCNPNSLFLSSIQTRIDLFSASIGPTKAGTKLVILLAGSSQSDNILNDPYNSDWCDFLGPFLKVKGNTMACAEGLFKTAFDAYNVKNVGKWNSTLNSYQWYPYTVMQKNAFKRMSQESNALVGAENLFSMYPNPSSTDVIFHFTAFKEDLSNAKLEIMDITGKTIISRSLNDLLNDNLTITFSEGVSGLYFCKVIGQDWSSSTSKLLIIK